MKPLIDKKLINKINNLQCECNEKFNNFNNLKSHTSHCNIYRNKIESIITKEIIQYIVNEKIPTKHAADIIFKDYILIKNNTIMCKAKKYGIKLLNSTEAAKSKYARNKYKETCIKKYGKENALSYGTECFLKRNDTVKKRYKKDNVFQVKEIKEKIKTTTLKNYGTDYFLKTPGINKNNGKKSKIHTIVEKWLVDDGINNFESETKLKELIKFNEFKNKIYKPRPDILIKELNLIIEIYGDKWHANPKIYNDEDLIYTWIGEVKAKTIRENNKIRENHINDCGYKIIVVWGSDIRNNNSTKIRQKLIKEIGKWKKQLQKSKKLNQKIDTIYL